MRVVVAGIGVQGEKRTRTAGSDVVATVDPVKNGVDYRDIKDVPLDSYQAVLACVPDGAKMELLSYLLGHGKHVLVEKPLISAADGDLRTLLATASRNQAVCYTAYNHRFEPHFVRMKALIDGGELGRIYTVRMFYGNGTARLVRESEWRDTGAGVLPDLGSHLLDTLLYWFGAEKLSDPMRLLFANRFENRSFDHVALYAQGGMTVQLEMTLLMWRNHFTCDILAENGTAHIESLCKWGPSTFRHRIRVLPSGRPREMSVTLVEDDPTWEAEYRHFKQLCRAGRGANIENDIWIGERLEKLGRDALERDAAK